MPRIWNFGRHSGFSASSFIHVYPFVILSLSSCFMNLQRNTPHYQTLSKLFQLTKEDQKSHCKVGTKFKFKAVFTRNTKVLITVNVDIFALLNFRVLSLCDISSGHIFAYLVVDSIQPTLVYLFTREMCENLYCAKMSMFIVVPSMVEYMNGKHCLFKSRS